MKLLKVFFLITLICTISGCSIFSKRERRIKSPCINSVQNNNSPCYKYHVNDHWLKRR
ncbi:type IV secretion system protein VirB7 [Ehrlichia sp. JZT12]